MKTKIFILICLCLALLSGSALAAAPGAESYTADIRLENGSASIVGSGAALAEGVLSIAEPGLYRLEGSLTGRIEVDAAGPVELVFCGLTVQGDSVALYAKRCESLTITLAPDFGQSSLSQSSDNDDAAVILSNAPLSFGGSGSLLLQGAAGGVITKGRLTVEGGSLGVVCGGEGLRAKASRSGSGDLVIAGGSLTVQAGDNGLRAEDSLIVSEGLVSLSAGGDGLKAANLMISGGSLSVTAQDEGADADSFIFGGGVLNLDSQGNGAKADDIIISGGSLTLTAALDGLHAARNLEINGGELALTCGGGGGDAINTIDTGGIMMGGGRGGRGASSEASAETATTTTVTTDVSAKALKSDGSILITGGLITISSADDGIHATSDVTIENGQITIISNDDGIHADEAIAINGGSILVEDCFEGIEATNITINGGDTDVFSVNDGLNTASGEMGFGMPFGGGTSSLFEMNGGTLDIVITGSMSNLGDGVDANGSFYMNGGYLTASTIGGTMENGLDSGSNFVVTGGIIAASGNSGMQESAAASSTQCTAVLSLGSYVTAGTECTVTDSEGSILLSYTPANVCNCIIVSHPDFEIGGTYTLTAGSLTQSFTFSSVTYSSSGEMGGFGGGRGGMRPF